MSVRRRLAALLAALTLLVSVVPPAALAASVTGINITLPTGHTISGVVVDFAGSPIEGVFVVPINEVGEQGGHYDISAGDGTFTLTAIRDGSITLLVDGGQDSPYLAGFAAEIGVVPSPDGAVVHTVPPDVQGVVIVLEKGLTLSGRVTNQAGDPVPNVKVDGRTTGVTGADGFYETVGIIPNTNVQLFVRPPDGSGYPSGSFANGTINPFFDAEQIVVGDANVSGIDIVLPDGVSISGSLSGTQGRPIVVDAFGANYGTDAVNADGSFEVDDLWPGTYDLSFTAPGSDYEQQFGYGYYGGQGLPLAAYEFRTSIDATTDVSGVIATVPELSEIHGVVTDPSGPISGAPVQASSPAGLVATLTGLDGTYAFINVPDGDYTIQVGATGHVSGYYSTTGTTRDPDLATPIHIAGADVTGVDVELSLGSSISGRVLGPSGEPVVGALVDPWEVNGGAGPFSPGGSETDANGQYVLTGLLESDYQLSVFEPQDQNYFGGWYGPGGYVPDQTEATIIMVRDAPTVVDRSPQPNAAGVARGANITMTLSADVKGVSRGTFEVREARTNRLVPGKVTYSAETDVATFDPVAPLGRRTTYVASVLAGITDLSGNPLAPTSWRFTTGP